MPAEMGSREGAVARAAACWDDGGFLRDLAARVAVRSESQNPAGGAEMLRYLSDEIGPRFTRMGYEVSLFDNPDPTAGPLLLAERIEDAALPTVLIYGHGDVVRGMEGQWREGLDPWTLHVEGDRIYGRGTADNKGQHSIAMAALEAVAKERGRLGFNVKFFLEMAEEVGSPGLGDFLLRERERLAADVMIALDGPRTVADRPDIRLGCRGGVAFDLVVDLRDSAHHSGHWGGLLADPGIVLAHALASMVTAKGRLLVPDWTPKGIPASVRAALAEIEFADTPGAPEIDPDWGEPGLTRAEKVLGWTSLIVLAGVTGLPDRPVNAVQGKARMRLQLRHTVDVDAARLLPALREHLDAHGFRQVAIHPMEERDNFKASRTDPANPWVGAVAASIAMTTGKKPSVIPNSSGSNPSQLFVDALGVPTIWLPQSYSGCGQHGPNEHGLGSLMREGLTIMAGIFWDIGAAGAPRYPTTSRLAP